MKRHPIAARLLVTARDLHSAAVHLLIDDWRLQPHFAVAQIEQKIAALIHLKAPGTLERQLDDSGIGAWSDHEVIFQLSLAAVIDEIHPGIDVLISGVIAHPSPDSQIVRHVPHATHPAPPIGVKIRRSRK